MAVCPLLAIANQELSHHGITPFECIKTQCAFWYTSPFGTGCALILAVQIAIRAMVEKHPGAGLQR